jgi:hypothetical protein
LADGWCRILSSYWLAHFFVVEISAKVLQYFGLDCGKLEFFILLTSRNIQTIVDSPALLETGSAEKIAVCAHTTHLLKK